MSARQRATPEERDFGYLPFVGDDQHPWRPPTVAGDQVTAYAAEWLLGATYAAAFLHHARAHASTDPCAARERLMAIIEKMMGGYPSTIAKGFVAGLGDALAHGAVDLDAGNVWARPTATAP